MTAVTYERYGPTDGDTYTIEVFDLHTGAVLATISGLFSKGHCRAAFAQAVEQRPDWRFPSNMEWDEYFRKAGVKV